MEGKIISSCGIVCSDCPAYPEQCPGCEASAGSPFWTDEAGMDVCPLYDCCRAQKGFAHCGLCPQLPCEAFTDLKDPSLNEEEHTQVLNERLAVLRLFAGAGFEGGDKT